MAAYRRVYDSRHLQADCQEPGSASEPYARQSSMGYVYLFLLFTTITPFTGLTLFMSLTGLTTHNTLAVDLPQYFVSSSQLYFYFLMDCDHNSRHAPEIAVFYRQWICFSFLLKQPVDVFLPCAQTMPLKFATYVHSPYMKLTWNTEFIFSQIPLTNVTFHMTLTCGSHDRILISCLNSIRRVPCNCRVKLFLQNSSEPNFFRTSKLTRCHFSTDIAEVKHVINMTRAVARLLVRGEVEN